MRCIWMISNELKHVQLAGRTADTLPMTNILDFPFNFLQSYTRSVPEKCSWITIESSESIFPAIKAVPYAFKERISKESETASTDCQDRRASSAEQVEGPGDRPSLGVLFLSKAKMVNSLWSRCPYVAEEEYRMLKVCWEIVERKNPGSFGTFTEEKEHEKHVIVDVAVSDENEDAGCYDLWQ